MRRFVEGMDRGQSTLFPECLEDVGFGYSLSKIDCVGFEDQWN
jgi:hypothetical protein